MESSPTTTIAPILLKNLLTSAFTSADKSFLTLSEKCKLLQLLRYLLISAVLFILRLLPQFLSLISPWPQNFANYPFNASNTEDYVSATVGGGDSGIARALSQLIAAVNSIPVSSPKYEVVRSLAERLIDENLREGSETLKEVNRRVLSAAFSRTLGRLETAAVDQDRESSGSMYETRVQEMNPVLRGVWYCGDLVWARLGRSKLEMDSLGISAEKLAAEVLWLAQKMVACDCGEEAVSKWASATKLAWVAISAQPRLQGSLVKVSAFLFKQARDLGVLEDGEQSKTRENIIKMLMSWLPLLCRASNGTDTPVLSMSERIELEGVLKDTIEMLEQKEEQEKVLSLWLHQYTLSPSSDWPNLLGCYERWCIASRKLLLLH